MTLNAGIQKRIRQLLSLAGTILIFNPWTGISPVLSRTDHDTQVPPSVEGDVFDQPAEPVPAPGTGTPSQSKREIQALLRDLGYYRGPVDGLFGDQTRQAIQGYQRSLGTPQTGVLTAQETAELYRSSSAGQRGNWASGCAVGRFLPG
jgi:peptidoglycan hydrolase-like protein with peptidoglycan-binding domain